MSTDLCWLGFFILLTRLNFSRARNLELSAETAERKAEQLEKERAKLEKANEDLESKLAEVRTCCLLHLLHMSFADNCLFRNRQRRTWKTRSRVSRTCKLFSLLSPRKIAFNSSPSSSLENIFSLVRGLQDTSDGFLRIEERVCLGLNDRSSVEDEKCRRLGRSWTGGLRFLSLFLVLLGVVLLGV